MSDLSSRAAELDLADPAPMRDRFLYPSARGSHAFANGYPSVAYFAGNSLGLQPIAAGDAVRARLDEWGSRAVTGHFAGASPWAELASALAEPMASLVGARADEIVVMNTLTVNLHLLMTAFYKPSATRHRIVVESGAFPSDDYAVASHVRSRGLDPQDSVVHLRADDRGLFDTASVLAQLDGLGDSISLVLLGGVNFRTGQRLDIEAITAHAHGLGALVIWDLAHAAGNIPLALHDWDVDAAAWCTYKYMNAGPGSIAAAFVHERHLDRGDVTTLNGWWGNDPANRFEMAPTIRPARGAAGWQLSNPPILAMAPIGPSLDLFIEAGGIERLRERSLRLTGHLEVLLDDLACTHRIEILTPRRVEDRGAQLSVLVDDAAAVTERLIDDFDVVPDDRPPSIIRFAPIPLYTSYEDCHRAVEALRAVVAMR